MGLVLGIRYLAVTPKLNAENRNTFTNYYTEIPAPRGSTLAITCIISTFLNSHFTSIYISALITETVTLSKMLDQERRRVPWHNNQKLII